MHSLGIVQWNSTRRDHLGNLGGVSGSGPVKFAPSPFYTFVYISLRVFYQLESLHLDDYNLIYSQNMNMGFDKILTAFPLKTQHFHFTNITQNQSNQQYSSKLNPTQPQNSFTTKTKLFLSTFGVFPNSNTNKRGLGFESSLKSLSNFNTKLPPCFFITLALITWGRNHKLLFFSQPSPSSLSPSFFFSFFLLNVRK